MKDCKTILSGLPGCPWCGAQPELIRAESHQHQHWIGCSNDVCTVQPSFSDWSIDGLIEDWSKRHEG